jgi:hypothetical protein
MDLTRVAGIVIIVGFIVFWLGNLYSPPGVYQETDTKVRLEIVDHYPARWAISQGAGWVGMGLLALGLLLLSLNLADEHGPWLTYIPAALNIIAMILVSVYLIGYISDPVAVWEGEGGMSLILTAAIMMMTAGILYGILFLQHGLPGWLGYVTIGFSIMALAAIVLANPPSFYVIALYFIIILAAGIVLVRG